MVNINESPRRKSKIGVFTVVNGFFLILAAVIMLYPFWYVVTGSLMRTSESIVNIFHLYTRTPSLDAYRSVFASYNIGMHFAASAYSSFIGMIASLFCTTIAAYALSRAEMPGRKAIMRLVLGAMLFNGGLIPTYMVVRTLRMINTWEALYVPGLVNLFYMIIMRTYFHGVSEDLLDAARIDGAGEWRILTRIVLPTSLPILATIALFYLVDRWNDLMSGIIYINDVNKQPLQAMLFRIINANTSTVSSTSSSKVNTEITGHAATVLTMLPILCVYPFLQRYFVTGMMVGSLKD